MLALELDSEASIGSFPRPGICLNLWPLKRKRWPSEVKRGPTFLRFKVSHFLDPGLVKELALAGDLKVREQRLRVTVGLKS